MHGARGWLLAVGWVGFLTLSAGCDRAEPSQETQNNATGESQGGGQTQPADAGRSDRLHQSFKEATTPPQALPPQTTITQKSVGKLYTEVVKQWPEIRFVSPDGKKLAYKASLDTTFGVIELDLWLEIAPNHVRNFVALARAGYYDGLFFEDVIGSLDNADKDLPRAVTAGSPEGDASELSSLGYWLQPEILKPEIAKERGIRHQPGTVGACHAYQQPNTASCRFYIMLGDAPAWDGEYTIFGQVTRGLDVVQKIFEHPQRAGDNVQPMRINKVTISVLALEK